MWGTQKGYERMFRSPLRPFNDDFRSLASRFLLPTPVYLVKRVGIRREVGDEGVPGLVVGSDLQVLLLANLHQPPDRTISLPVTPGSGIRDGEKNPDQGWISRIIFSGTWTTFFGLKILKFFAADPDPRSFRPWIRDPGSGMEKFGSGNRNISSTYTIPCQMSI